MCCERPHHKMSSCCCFPRRFVSSAEEKERLERYREQLKKELAGVEEELKKMG
jgi:hypothetical protein